MALPINIQRFIDEQAERAGTRYDDLRAVLFNGTTKRSPEVSTPMAWSRSSAGGIPAYGNSTHDWELGHPDHPNPERRRQA